MVLCTPKALPSDHGSLDEDTSTHGPGTLTDTESHQNSSAATNSTNGLYFGG